MPNLPHIIYVYMYHSACNDPAMLRKSVTRYEIPEFVTVNP